MKVTILGCGHSLGVPIIGCDCAVCTSDNNKNKRSRVSVWVEAYGLSLVIDTSPDFRIQAMRQGIKHIDAVLYTHDHADHTHGIDDLRPFNYIQDSAIQIYGNAETIDSLKRRFSYSFLPRPEKGDIFRPSLESHVIEGVDIAEFYINNNKIMAFEQRHGKTKSLGYRIGGFAYSTDVDVLPEAAFAALQGVECWVVDCLRYTPSYSHSSLPQTLEWIARVKPKKAILTHMAHEFDYEKLSAELPDAVFVGYDGMVVEIE